MPCDCHRCPPSLHCVSSNPHLLMRPCIAQSLRASFQHTLDPRSPRNDALDVNWRAKGIHNKSIKQINRLSQSSASWRKLCAFERAASCLPEVASTATFSPSGCLAASAAPAELVSPLMPPPALHCCWWSLSLRAAPLRSVPWLLWRHC